MQILLAPTENFVFGEETALLTDEAASQTVLSVKNAKGFSVNDYIVIGELGSEQTELRLISEIAADLTTITISVATNFAHNEDEKISQIRFNRRKFYRSTTETGTYTHLAGEGSPIDIHVDKPEGTEFEDSAGTSTSWYKATYYNSTSLLESSLDDAVAVIAGDSEHYTSIYQIKREAGFTENQYIESDTVNDFREEAENQAESAVATVYQLPFSSKPRIFRHIVRLLAAGLLLAKEYGMEADVEVSKTGERKIQRAEELLQKIADGSLTLRDENGNELSKLSSLLASCSNAYSSGVDDKGEMFNLTDERFKMTDPDDPLASSMR